MPEITKEKIYKMTLKFGEKEGSMQVIANSEVSALDECLKLLDLAGISAEIKKVDLFEQKVSNET